VFDAIWRQRASLMMDLADRCLDSGSPVLMFGEVSCARRAPPYAFLCQIASIAQRSHSTMPKLGPYCADLRRHRRAKVSWRTHRGGEAWRNVSTIGPDSRQHVFQAHGASASARRVP
jgi:hypothetical protein